MLGVRMTLKQRIYGLYPHSTRALAEWISLTTFFLGVWFLNPLLDSFSVSIQWRVMANVAPEWVWGLAFAVTGFTNLIAIRQMRSRLRNVTGIALSMVLVFLSVLTIMGNNCAASVPIYSSMALAAIWSHAWRQNR